MSPHFSLGQGKSELNFNFPLSHFSISRVMLNNDRSRVFKSSQTVHFSCDPMNDFTLSTRRVLRCWKKKIENVCLSLRWAGTKHRAERTVGQLNNVFLSLMIKWSCWRNVEERAEPKKNRFKWDKQLNCWNGNNFFTLWLLLFDFYVCFSFFLSFSVFITVAWVAGVGFFCVF
jgi:hypothetical protein